MPDNHIIAVSDAIQAERGRVAEIGLVIMASRGVLPQVILDHMHGHAVASGWSADTLRSSLWSIASGQGADLVRVPAPVSDSTRSGDHDGVVDIRDAMADAIAVRAMSRYVPAASRHSDYLAMHPLDMARELLRLRGQDARTSDPLVIAERALTTTSDFPLLLAAAANKMLLTGYELARPTYRDIFHRRDFKDFRPHRYLRAGDFPSLVQLPEGGEMQVGTLSESQETAMLTTFARRVRVTRQMLVNDDLGAFTDFAAMIGQRIADFENATAYALLNTANGDGPTLATGAAPVFSTAAARANKAAIGTALDLANVAAGRAAIMRQRSLDGMPIALGDRMRLLVGPTLELTARQLTVPVEATQVTQANVFAGMIEPVVEPLIAANRWYLLADPAAAPLYIYGYLDGATGPQVTTGPIQGVDGVEVRVIFDFGVGAVDWRGGWFNPGA